MNSLEYNDDADIRDRNHGGDITMPLGTGDFGGDASLDPLANAGTGRKFSSSTTLIVGVVLVAVVVLFSMRKLAQVTASTNGEVETAIVSFLEKVKGEGNTIVTSGPRLDDAKDAQVLAVLNESYLERQVPLRDIRKNPFIIFGGVVITTDTDVKPPPPDDSARWARLRDERKVAIEAAGKRITLKAVMGGSSPLAILNDETRRVGETIAIGPEESAIIFRVSEIEHDSVTLVSEDAQYSVVVPITLKIKRGL